MKVGEARQTYSAQLKAYNEQKYKLSVQRKELKEKMENTENGAELYADEAATLELTYNAVSEKYDEYKDYMDQLMDQWEVKFNAVAADQQADAAKDYGQEMGKILQVARRIMHGDIVPMSDEKKLLDFDKDLYQMAKSIGAMAKLEKRKKYKSLWEDEEKKEYDDPAEVADDQDAFGSGPEVVSVEATMEAATADAGSQE